MVLPVNNLTKHFFFYHRFSNLLVLDQFKGLHSVKTPQCNTQLKTIFKLAYRN